MTQVVFSALSLHVQSVTAERDFYNDKTTERIVLQFLSPPAVDFFWSCVCGWVVFRLGASHYLGVQYTNGRRCWESADIQRDGEGLCRQAFKVVA